MKVLAVNASPRKQGNTAMLLQKALEPIAAEGIETETCQLGGKVVRGCTACYACFKNKNGRCVLDDDPVNELIAKMSEADGMLLGSPTYFADVTPELKALIDRAGLVSLANGVLLRRKVGAGVIAVRRGGAVCVLDSINHFFLINQMVIPGSCYWNFAVGREKGEVAGDDEGIRTMTVLGENMAWALKKLAD